MYEEHLDKGQFRVVTTPPDAGTKTYIESDDYEHAARLQVTGKFDSLADKELYAMALAELLNNARR
jgi:hypothetical protein